MGLLYSIIVQTTKQSVMLFSRPYLIRSAFVYLRANFTGGTDVLYKTNLMGLAAMWANSSAAPLQMHIILGLVGGFGVAGHGRAQRLC